MKWNVGWGVVSACNMNCEFCYSKHVREEVSQLGYNEWIRFVDDNHEFIKTINYGTGESTLSHDWFRLVNYIHINYPHIKQALTTNGFLAKQIHLNSDYYAIIRDSIAEIDVSLDFCNEEKHNNFRGASFAYQGALDTLRFSQENDILATIVFIGINEVLQPENLEGLFAISEKYNTKLRMNIFRPVDGINEHSKKFIASFDNIVNALEWISKNHAITAVNDPLFAAVCFDNYVSYDPSGMQSIRILSDGSITPSTYLIQEKFRRFNIKQPNILQKIRVEDSGLERIIPTDCTDCQYVIKCKGGVYDRRYLWYGNFDQRDPYCVYREGNYITSPKSIQPDENFQSVHDGYLPTFFFRAKNMTKHTESLEK